jgi:hypothetical protein
MNKNKMWKIFLWILNIIILWTLISTFIFSIRNPDLSQMRVFLHTPLSFIGKF